MGRGEKQVSRPHHFPTFEASWPFRTATQIPNWLSFFHKQKFVSTNEHIALPLRLILFDAVIFPAILFGLAAPAFDQI
jgi:hypothetical protein